MAGKWPRFFSFLERGGGGLDGDRVEVRKYEKKKKS